MLIPRWPRQSNPKYIRLTAHDLITQRPKRESLKHSQGYKAKQMIFGTPMDGLLSQDETYQTMDQAILYVEILSKPLSDVEGKVALEIFINKYVSSTTNKSMDKIGLCNNSFEIFIDPCHKVKDVIATLNTNLQSSGSNPALRTASNHNNEVMLQEQSLDRCSAKL